MEQGKHPGKNKIFLKFKFNTAFMVSFRTTDQARGRDFLCRPIFTGTKLFIDPF